MDDDEEIFGKWSDSEEPKPTPPAKPAKRPAKRAPKVRSQPEASDDDVQERIAALKSASKIYAQASKKAKTVPYDLAAQEYYAAQFWQNEHQLKELQKKSRK